MKKRARTVQVPQEIQEETKEETKTVRPDVRAYYPIYSDTPGAWQADLMFIPYTNLKKKPDCMLFLCLVNINTKWAFVRQCNYDAKKNNDPDFKPRGANQKVSVGAGGEAYGITIDGNAKSAQKTKTQFQNIFEIDVPKAEEEVRKDIGTF